MKSPRLPRKRHMRVGWTINAADAPLVRLALALAADHLDGSGRRLRGCAPELHRRAARLRRIVAAAVAGGAPR